MSLIFLNLITESEIHSKMLQREIDTYRGLGGLVNRYEDTEPIAKGHGPIASKVACELCSIVLRY